MPNDVRTVTFDFPLAKGLVSNQNEYKGDPDGWTTFTDLYIDATDRLRKRPGRVLVGTDAASEVTAIYQFVYTSLGSVLDRVYRTFGNAIQSWNGVAWVNETLPYTPGSAAWVFVAWGNRCFAVNGIDDMIYTTGSGTWYRVGQDGPAAAPTYNLTSTGTPITTGTLSVTQGSRTVNASATPFLAAHVGRTIIIKGNRYVIGQYNASNQVLLEEPYREATDGVATYVLYPGLMDWELPPKYCFCYYNSTTGHLTNRSPVLELTEQDQIGRTPTLTLTYSSAAWANGYDKIWIFRTPRNGNVLVFAEEINNTNSNGTTTWSEDENSYLDRHLGTIEAPIVTNRKPPAGLKSIAVHQNRLWGIKDASGTNPPYLYFSLLPEETSAGRAEECWPAKNARAIPDAPTGLVAIGSAGDSALLVQTQRREFSVAGYDNLSYYLYELPTRGRGSHQGSAIPVSGSLCILSRDRRLFLGGEDIGRDIQDKLNGILPLFHANARLFWFSTNDWNWLLLSVTTTGTTQNVTYIYDLNRGTWYEWAFGFRAAAEVVENGQVQLWLSNAFGATYRLDPTTFTDWTGTYQPQMVTAHLRPMGHTGRAAFRYLRIHPDTALVGYQGQYWARDNSNYGELLDFNARPSLFQTDATELVIEPTRPVADSVFRFKILFPINTFDMYVDRVAVTFSADFDSVETTQ